MGHLSDLYLFLEHTNIASYADLVIAKLEEDSSLLIKWINNNHMKANPDNFHILLTGNDETLSVNVGDYKILNRGSEKLLGFTVDSKLSFDDHVISLCKKASQKLHALARVAQYMDIPKRRAIVKAFIDSQFGYCPLVWICHSMKLNNRINKIHERALRLVYEESNATFEELLTKDGAVTIHGRNIQLLAIEMYKVIKGDSPEIIREIFQLKERDIYHSNFPFESQNARTVTARRA